MLVGIRGRSSPGLMAIGENGSNHSDDAAQGAQGLRAAMQVQEQRLELMESAIQEIQMRSLDLDLVATRLKILIGVRTMGFPVTTLTLVEIMKTYPIKMNSRQIWWTKGAIFMEIKIF